MALEHGHAIELARGLSTELELSGLLGTPPAIGAELVALADALCTSTGDALARQLFHLGRSGHRASSSLDLPGMLEDAERFLELSTLQPQATHSYDRSWGAFHKAYALCRLGRGVDALKLVQEQIEEVRSRGDATILPAWVYIEHACCPQSARSIASSATWRPSAAHGSAGTSLRSRF